MNLTLILKDKKISLAQMLDARERRVIRQRELMAEGGQCMISYTLNIPGEIKQFPLAEQFFLKGLRRLEKALERGRLKVLEKKVWIEDTGSEAMLSLDAPAEAVKNITAALEESTAASRLYDMDVLSPDGVKMSRESLGYGPRRCIICNDEVMACAPRRKHSAEELSHAAVRLMYDDMAAEFADGIAKDAQRALLYEVCVSPKPGLVDRFNSGSHRDMDLFDFVDSAAVLRSYFFQCVLLGIEKSDLTPQGLFRSLRQPGMEAEERMLDETGGINVHKGAIFSLGILCAARGRLWALGKKADSGALFDTARAMARNVTDELASAPESAGKRIFKTSGITGIRGEAMRGYPSVRDRGLPLLEQLLSEGLSMNDAAAVVLLHLLLAVEDTNMIRRSSLQRFEEVRDQIGRLLEETPVPSLEKIADLDRDFIRENLSPGGSADMLALTLFMHFLKKREDFIF